MLKPVKCGWVRCFTIGLLMVGISSALAQEAEQDESGSDTQTDTIETVSAPWWEGIFRLSAGNEPFQFEYPFDTNVPPHKNSSIGIASAKARAYAKELGDKNRQLLEEGRWQEQIDIDSYFIGFKANYHEYMDAYVGLTFDDWHYLYIGKEDFGRGQIIFTGGSRSRVYLEVCSSGYGAPVGRQGIVLVVIDPPEHVVWNYNDRPIPDEYGVLRINSDTNEGELELLPGKCMALSASSSVYLFPQSNYRKSYVRFRFRR